MTAPPALHFDRVTHTAERVAIVGSGPSLRGIDLKFPRNVKVIAINAALDHLKRADFFFTLDAAYRGRGEPNMQRLLNRRKRTVYYVAVREYGRRIDGVLHLQRGRRWLPDGSPAGMSDDPGMVRLGNSVAGGLQIARLMGVRKAGLFGVDGSGGYAWGNGAPGNLNHLPALFESYLPQLEGSGIEVMNASLGSTVTCFPRRAVSETIEWLAE